MMSKKKPNMTVNILMDRPELTDFSDVDNVGDFLEVIRSVYDRTPKNPVTDTRVGISVLLT